MYHQGVARCGHMQDPSFFTHEKISFFLILVWNCSQNEINYTFAGKELMIAYCHDGHHSSMCCVGAWSQFAPWLLFRSCGPQLGGRGGAITSPRQHGSCCNTRPVLETQAVAFISPHVGKKSMREYPLQNTKIVCKNANDPSHST